MLSVGLVKSYFDSDFVSKTSSLVLSVQQQLYILIGALSALVLFSVVILVIISHHVTQ